MVNTAGMLLLYLVQNCLISLAFTDPWRSVKFRETDVAFLGSNLQSKTN